MVIYLIGPSGVGKSTLAQEIQKRLPDVCLFNIDCIIKEQNPSLYYHQGNRWGEFAELAMINFQNIEKQFISNNNLALIDVGAGFLETDKALTYLTSRFGVTIYDEPKRTFEKVRTKSGSIWINKTMDDFRNTEYSPKRIKIYNSQKLFLDISGLSLESSIARLLKLIQK